MKQSKKPAGAPEEASPIQVEYLRPWLYPKQAEALFDPSRFVLIEASTKSGKTVGALAWLLEQAMMNGKPGRSFWWVAPYYSQAKIAYSRMKSGLTAGSFAAHDGELMIELITGAKIWFKSGEKPDALYGEDVFAAVLDEASRCREQAWYAVRSTLAATRGPVRIIGNVRGRKNWAYRLARKAEQRMRNNIPGWKYFKIVARDAVQAGVLDAEEVADARESIPDLFFRELFEAEAADDSGNPFGESHIGLCIQPLSAAEPAAWGWDLAKHQDWSVGVGLDVTGRVCRLIRFQENWEHTMNRIRAETKGSPALVDSTGVGDPILEQLQAHNGENYSGYQFSQKSKQQLLEGLALAIQNHYIGFPDGVIRTELESFEYVYVGRSIKYSAPEGLHDDAVIALALAWHQLGHREIIPEPDIFIF